MKERRKEGYQHEIFCENRVPEVILNEINPIDRKKPRAGYFPRHAAVRLAKKTSFYIAAYVYDTHHTTIRDWARRKAHGRLKNHPATGAVPHVSREENVKPSERRKFLRT